MKSLKDFLNKTIIENTDIHDGLLSNHFYIEFNFSDSNLKSKEYYLNEKYGTYDSEVDFVISLSKYILDDLKESDSFSYTIKKEDLEEAGFYNIFFKEITIKVGNSYTTGFINTVKYDEKSRLFESILITINNKEYNDFDNLLKVLTHELTHAWEEYGRYINNSELKLSDLSNKESSYVENVFKKPDNDGEKICKTILYFLTNFEINAYISELSTVLEKEGLEIKDYNDALNHFKKTDIWINYSKILDIIENLDEKYKEDFKNYYNRINKTSLTFNKIQKKLLDKCKKVFNKISTLIPKIYYEWYTKNEIKESKLRNKNTLFDTIILNNDTRLNDIIKKDYE